MSSSIPESVQSLIFANQPYDYFLVLDVEATCTEVRDRAMDYPNEIIEWPVCLLGWKDKQNGILEIIDEFHTFVKPSWRPQLTEYCKNLTGITQDQVDVSPNFANVIDSTKQFLVSHKLLDSSTEERLARFCWCTDGPWDICDFVVKQCFISKVKLPAWLMTNIINVRSLVRHYRSLSRHLSLNLSLQLSALNLCPFEGRQHSGIDDARNIARIVMELAKRKVKLQSNLIVLSNKRWAWMGRSGRILEDRIY